MKTTAQQKQANRMSRVMKTAIALIECGIATTQSDAMKMAWVKIKTQERIAAGQKVSFVKKSTGEVRTVTTPAPYVSTGEAKAESGRKPQPQLIVFCDLEKEGHNTISCDIRTIIE